MSRECRIQKCVKVLRFGRVERMTYLRNATTKECMLVFKIKECFREHTGEEQAIELARFPSPFMPFPNPKKIQDRDPVEPQNPNLEPQPFEESEERKNNTQCQNPCTINNTFSVDLEAWHHFVWHHVIFATYLNIGPKPLLKTCSTQNYTKQQ